MRVRLATLLGGVFVGICVGSLGCGSTSRTPAAPSVPAGLSAQGSLGNIHLAWSVSSGGGLTGYNVYRSIDGTSWSRLNPSIVTAAAYDDSIASPAGDGVVYQYEVTAVGDRESGPSQVARSVHGTRLPAYNGSGFTTTAAESPYVAEGKVLVDGGDLVVDSGTRLYVVDDAVVDLERWADGQSGTLRVKGLLRVLATPAAHATFTAHRVGGALADNDGFTFWFDGAESYDPADGSGTLLQNALITNLAWGNSNGGFKITASSPRLYNLNATSNSSTGGSYIFLFSGAGALIQNCSFDRLVLVVTADLRGTTFKMDHVRFRRGYYSIWFANIDSPGIAAGQIELNDFDGAKAAYLFTVNAASPVPLGNNYWQGGAGWPPVPAVTTTYSTTPFEFATARTAAPSGTGPSWQP